MISLKHRVRIASGKYTGKSGYIIGIHGGPGELISLVISIGGDKLDVPFECVVGEDEIVDENKDPKSSGFGAAAEDSPPNVIHIGQPLPTQGARSVTAEIRKLLDAREAKGIATYGRSLETFNGRDSAKDLVEELIDATQYALQWQMEREKLIETLTWIVQTVHQAYHSKRTKTWRECHMDICTSVQKAVGPA